MALVFAEFYCCIDCLKEALLIDTGNDKVGFIDSLWAFGRSADADGREGMTNACEERSFLREGARV